MSAPDKEIEQYYKLQPTKYSVLLSLTITQGIGTAGVFEQSLSLVMSKNPGDEGPHLLLTFYGVKNLTFEQPDWSLICIGHLEIRPGREFPDVFANFVVHDPDQEHILRFECAHFESFVQ